MDAKKDKVIKSVEIMPTASLVDRTCGFLRDRSYVFFWGQPIVFAKSIAIMAWTGKSHIVGDFRNRSVAFEQ